MTQIVEVKSWESRFVQNFMKFIHEVARIEESPCTIAKDEIQVFPITARFETHLSLLDAMLFEHIYQESWKDQVSFTFRRFRCRLNVLVTVTTNGTTDLNRFRIKVNIAPTNA